MRKLYGEVDGNNTYAYVLKNATGMKVVILDYGAIIASIQVPDQKGKLRDIVLGYDNAQDYNDHSDFFGAVVGRNCNRIAKARVELDKVSYSLERNDGPNNLHSGKLGTHNRIWKVKQATNQRLELQCVLPDMEQGMPGNVTVQAIYELTEENELKVTYQAVSDRKTVLNMTNHSYFNLNGHNGGSVSKHLVKIHADYYTPINDDLIPTGKVEKVSGTPFDFTDYHEVGERINLEEEQLTMAGGYDHNFAIGVDEAGKLDRTKVQDKEVKCIVDAIGDESGIHMKVSSNAPGMQFYTGNYVGRQKGKDGVEYTSRNGMCFEPQYFPNAVNMKKFASSVYKAGEQYSLHINYKFSVEQ